MNTENTNSLAASQSLWFYADANNQPVGPMPFAELEKLAAEGVIQPGTQVIENGAEHWRSFREAPRPVATSVPPPVPPATLLSSVAGKRPASRRSILIAGAFALIAVVGMIAGRKDIKPTSESESSKPPAISTVPLDSPAYKLASLDAGQPLSADAPALSEFQTLLRDVAGKSKLSEESVADKVWAARKKLAGSKRVEVSALQLLRGMHTVVTKAEFEVPFDSTLAALAVQIVAEREKNGTANTATKTYRKSDFSSVFDGQFATEVGKADVQTLRELIAAIYEGKATVQDAKPCVFLFDAIEGSLKSVVGDYLIYSVAGSYQRTFEFALRRDPAFEREQKKNYPDIAEFYDELRRSTLDSRDPLRRDALIVEKMEEFTTEGGFVKRVPVVKAIQLTP